MKIIIKNTLILGNEGEKDLYIKDGIILGFSAPAGFSETDTYTIDGRGKLLIPGLINCHTHTYMSLFRNYADDLNFDQWLFGKILPAEDKMLPEDAYWCNLLSHAEMIKTGTTCFAEMHMFKNQSVRALNESGMRAVLARGLIGESTGDEAAKSRLDEAFEEKKYAEGNDRISFMLGPHAIYTCGKELLKELPHIAKKNDMGLMIHLAEGLTEYKSSMENNGLSPTAYLDSLGFFDIKTLAAHCVHVDNEDIKILARKGVSVATNPISNMKLGNGFAPIPEMYKEGVNICVGTDSASSNNSLNMFRELSMLSYVHKGLNKDSLCLGAKEIMDFATMGGARAIGLEGEIGSIEPGKKADLVLIDLNKPWMQPVNNPLFSLVYSANGSEADTVIIDGKIVMERGELKTLDEEKIIYETNKIKKRVLEEV